MRGFMRIYEDLRRFMQEVYAELRMNPLFPQFTAITKSKHLSYKLQIFDILVIPSRQLHIQS